MQQIRSVTLAATLKDDRYQSRYHSRPRITGREACDNNSIRGNSRTRRPFLSLRRESGT